MPATFGNNQQGRSSAVLVVALAAALQVALSPVVNVFNGTFNFCLVAVAVLSITGQSATLVPVGFGLGLFYDLTGSAPVGVMSLLLAVAGYFAASSLRGVSARVQLDAVRPVALTVVAVNIVYSVAMFALGIDGSLLDSLGRAVSSTALDLIAAVPFLMLAGRGSSGHDSFRASGGRGRRRGGPRCRIGR